MKNKFDTYTKGFEIIDSQNNDPLDYLRTPRYSRKSLDIPARILNHWDKMELLLKSNPLGATYTFNLAEAFWIKLIQKLRAYNLPLELIKQLKVELCMLSKHDELMKGQEELINYFASLNSQVSKTELEKIFKSADFIEFINSMKSTVLENLLLDLIITRADHRIFINENGEVFFYNKEVGKANEADFHELNRFMSNSYMSISLFEIIKELIADLGEDECSEFQNILSKDEAMVLKLLKQEDISKIEINFNDKSKRPETIKVTKNSSVSNFNKVQDLILRNGYQDISIKTQKGKVVQCTNTTKYKLDTE
jgi:DNA-binding transcriptional MerR regulator